MTTERATIKCEAVFSDDSLHRYSLSKIWDKTLPLANVITIAPSEDFNVTSDTTTSIICNNIYLLGMGGFVLTNLISKIGADVKKLKSTKDLWNADTDKYIKETALKADKIIIAWGKFTETRKVFSDREQSVLKLLEPQKDKLFQITDGKERKNLHPLTPSIRHSFILHSYY
ncbi:DUF1643 domain-containing protein [uncultured Ruminococcus sp.]|uniref:DUF1643 domain-containing protein n=1 Tax=uncultured Ruminococcus sp. TaxID=165186 RepID=UPI0025E39231|nr:DUF1643 domain-containing protein [uncultured Ruminococcus sp.]